MRKRRGVAIYGCHPAGDVEVPDGCEAWTLNDCYKVVAYDRLYELHRLSDRPWRDNSDHHEELRMAGSRLWGFSKHTPRTKLYPVLDVLDRYPAYHTNSVSWMLAHALLEERPKVYLYGLHFESRKERLLERPCVEFWIGFLRGQGVEVVVPARSPLLKGRGLYGLEDSVHNAVVEPQSFDRQLFEESSELRDWAYRGVYEPEER